MNISPLLRWPLPKHDYWSTPFAESLLRHLALSPGIRILDIASGHGIPAFYLAEQIGPTGEVLAIDVSAGQVARARAIQGRQLPWLRFECMDMRSLPPALPAFDRITGNLSVMFFRPNRFEAVRGLVERLNPGGQLVLTFPSYVAASGSGDDPTRADQGTRAIPGLSEGTSVSARWTGLAGSTRS